MIEIKLAADDKIQDICSKLNLQRLPSLKIYVARERDEELGCCGFEIEGESGRLLFTSMNDDGLAMIEDGILRATLAYMYEKGVSVVTSAGSIEKRMLTRLGFKEIDGALTLDLKKSFLAQGCTCSNKNK